MKMLDKKYVDRLGSCLGAMDFGDTVDITDPCYSKDVWCRLNNVRIVPGTYEARANTKDEGECGVRVARLGIYKSPKIYRTDRRTWTAIGDIGVDAGLAGIFAHKADFTDDEWVDFCNTIKEGFAWAFDDPAVKGFCSTSGFGDGCYDVIGHPSAENPDIFDGIEIRFL